MPMVSREESAELEFMDGDCVFPVVIFFHLPVFIPFYLNHRTNFSLHVFNFCNQMNIIPVAPEDEIIVVVIIQIRR